MTQAGMTFAWIGAAALAGLAAIAAAPQAAAKGGGGGAGGIPPADTGGICFESANWNAPGTAVIDKTIWGMNTDGTGKTSFHRTAPGAWPVSIPTSELHGNQRWFLEIRETPGLTYANGHTCEELYAVSEDGSLARQVTRSVAGDGSGVEIEPNNTSNAGVTNRLPGTLDKRQWAMRDGFADGKVSYLAHRVAPDTTNDSPGLYVAAVDWDQVLAGTFVPAVPQIVPNAGFVNVSTATYVNGNYCWSPDGAAIAFDQRTTPGAADDAALFAIDATGTNRRVLWNAGDAFTCSWSSRNQIAFVANVNASPEQVGVLRVNSDGTGLATIVPVPAPVVRGASPGETRKWVMPSWSPSGSHVVLTYLEYPKVGGSVSLDQKTWIYDVYRVAADGTGLVNLTADFTPQAMWGQWCR